MNTNLRKWTCLALALSMLLAASGATAAQITMPSSLWEARFQALLAYAAESGLPLAEQTDFSVAEFSAPDGTIGYEHSLDLAGFMKVFYYDGGNDDFDVAILSIHLDHGGAPVELALMALYFTILAVDEKTTQEEFGELMEAMSPNFGEVFAGEEHVNGMQAATLRGVGFMMEINDDERYIKLYANVWITSNGE
ncbi:MAG: hypothetical protein FWF86_03170 [Clostridia bacterium]|nr:hypothetical protein [Clostridia bacterium]